MRTNRPRKSDINAFGSTHLILPRVDFDQMTKDDHIDLVPTTKEIHEWVDPFFDQPEKHPNAREIKAIIIKNHPEVFWSKKWQAQLYHYILQQCRKYWRKLKPQPTLKDKLEAWRAKQKKKGRRR
ncbi:MAG TPA: hypothetical protein VEA59_04115 [Patescibacteria group bacterium]|nr:hypothetical protein [Patescibacteria group bacterium]